MRQGSQQGRHTPERNTEAKSMAKVETFPHGKSGCSGGQGGGGLSLVTKFWGYWGECTSR